MNYNFNNINKNDKKVFLMLSPDYANVGDIAISLAQEKILKEIYSDRKIIEIPMLGFYNYMDDIKNIINNDDIITIIGGGNMGSVYIEGENRRRSIIEEFPNNKIISFPQSIDFEHTSNGKEEFEKSINIYKKHKNLSIFARENRSYNIMKENFKNDVYLVPDTVFYLTNSIVSNNNSREKITICLRDDAEKSKTSISTSTINELLKNSNLNNLNYITTYLEGLEFTPSEKKEIFENLLKEFKSSKFVITDRLHGMIFSLITHTPCIVFDNSNKKISATYNTWLTNCPLVKLIDGSDHNAIMHYIKEFSNFEDYNFDLNINEKFKKLFDILKK